MNIAGQTLSQRYIVMMGALAILLVLNVWRWWPVSGETVDKDKIHREIRMPGNDINFLNFITPRQKEVAVTRNLFAPVVKKASYRKPVKAPKKINTPAVKVEKPRSVLSAFKLEGILDTDGKVQAFLSRQDDVYMVYRGERLTKTIVVEKITHDGILLKDESNGSSQWVVLGGD